MRTSSTIHKRKVGVAGTLLLVGLLILALLFFFQTRPDPWWLWALFTGAFVLLEWRAVEINHHLFVSPSIMVAITAGAVFGPRSALLGVTVMAAAAFVTPKDFKQRRVFEPVANFGQFALTVSASIGVLSLLHPGDVTKANVGQLAAASIAAALVYGAVNYGVVSVVVKRIYGQELRPWSRLSAAVVPYLGMGFLGGMLGAAYLLVGDVTLPLIVAVFFVGHMTFASYGDLLEAQEATLRGFIKALEAKDLYTRGHTERVAHFSQVIGQEMGYDANGLERLRWAALIHDVGKLAVPRDLITKRSRLSDQEREQMEQHVHSVEDLLAEVDFLQPMVAIASKHHANFDGSGYGGSAHQYGETPGQEACILAVADAFDAMTSTRSYRVALTQAYAFDELRANAGSQFDPECVEALIAALKRSGEVYGSLDVDDEEQARLLASGQENVYRIHG
ncbi:MAG: HD domain-containing protein [Acidimicrobiia bacterium]|nr:HD domain-containing protein [Acidimicrobiia bacterium]